MITKSCPRVALNYECISCDYTTSKKSSYTKQILTARHILLTDSNRKVEKSCSEFKCKICEKIYKSRVGLWGHKKKCSQKEDKLENTMTALDVNALVIDLIKQNQELQTQLIELSKEKTMTNCHNNNTNNNHFNLQFFLHR